MTVHPNLPYPASICLFFKIDSLASAHTPSSLLLRSERQITVIVVAITAASASSRVDHQLVYCIIVVLSEGKTCWHRNANDPLALVQSVAFADTFVITNFSKTGLPLLVYFNTVCIEHLVTRKPKNNVRTPSLRANAFSPQAFWSAARRRNSPLPRTPFFFLFVAVVAVHPPTATP